VTGPLACLLQNKNLGQFETFFKSSQGNHDAFPKSQFPSTPQAGDLYHRVAELWKDILLDSSKVSFENKGKLQITILNEFFFIISLHFLCLMKTNNTYFHN
jgi:hypothetical protein